MATAQMSADRANQLAEMAMVNVRAFIEVKNAYDQCAAEVREAVNDMVAIVKSADATEEERTRATLTIVEALFPSLAVDGLECGAALRARPESVAANDKMKAQEATFAERVAELMRHCGMTQEELARLSGVGQPAISNMLNRQCRPQRRTVHRIAAALDVSPAELWPSIADESPGIP